MLLVNNIKKFGAKTDNREINGHYRVLNRGLYHHFCVFKD